MRCGRRMGGVKSQPFGSSVANGNVTKNEYNAANLTFWFSIEFSDYDATIILQLSLLVRSNFQEL